MVVRAENEISMGAGNDVLPARPESLEKHVNGDGAPLVSVIIPAYNAAATLKRAVDSVLSQNYPSIELILVDDASSDATHDLIKSLQDPRLRYIKLAINGGVSNARNQGIEVARGELIAFLDADDEWLPGKLELQVAEITSRDGVTLVSCLAYDVAPSGEISGKHNFGRMPVRGSRSWVGLLEFTSVTTSTVLTSKACLKKAGGFDSKLRVAEDQDLWIRLALLGDVAIVDKFLVLKHFVPDSLSLGGPPEDELIYLLPMLMRHLNAVRTSLSKQEIRAILCRRYSRIGCNLYARGMHRQGLKLMGNAVLHGAPLHQHLRFILGVSALGKILKNILKKTKRRAPVHST